MKGTLNNLGQLLGRSRQVQSGVYLGVLEVSTRAGSGRNRGVEWVCDFACENNLAHSATRHGIAAACGGSVGDEADSEFHEAPSHT